MKMKKGQGGTQAATLVVLIIVLILLYLLFLPPEVRDEILEGNGSASSSSNNNDEQTNKTFLLENPGTLTTLGEKDIEHTIPPVNLFATEDAKILEGISSIYIENSWLSTKRSDITFYVSDIKNTENALLTFLLQDHKGVLSITLNGFEVFYGELTSANPEPIKLGGRFLKEGDNVLHLEVDPVGWRFWRKNTYSLQNVQITADVTDVSDQLSRNLFIVTTTEKNNVKRSILRFSPECLTGQVGVLNVAINGHTVHASVPDCGNRVVVEFLPDILISGENTLVFRTEKGSYLIDLIKISSELKEAIQPVYYFDIGEDVLDEVNDGDYDIVLKMLFVDDTEEKEGEIIINGRKIGIFQKEKEYERVINDYLIEGNNAIKLVPQDSLEITRLEVVRED